MPLKSIVGLFQYAKSNSLWTSILQCFLLILLLFSAGTAVARTASVFETPPTLRAQDLAPSTLLNGNGFRVDDAVPSDGLTADFTIRSDVGTFQAHAMRRLATLLVHWPGSFPFAPPNARDYTGTDQADAGNATSVAQRLLRSPTRVKTI